jgi:hypothetical protein
LPFPSALPPQSDLSEDREEEEKESDVEDGNAEGDDNRKPRA